MIHDRYDHATPLDECAADVRAITAQVAADRHDPPPCIHPVLRTLASLIHTTTDGPERVEAFLPRLVGTSINVYRSAPMLAVRAACHFADATDSELSERWRSLVDRLTGAGCTRSQWHMVSTELATTLAEHSSEHGMLPAANVAYAHAFAVADPFSGLSGTDRMDRSCWAAWHFGRASIERAGCSPDTLLDYLATAQAEFLGDLRTVVDPSEFDVDAWHATTHATV